jgi:pimeloyl-ACP methyl ester carboxylesterase
MIKTEDGLSLFAREVGRGEAIAIPNRIYLQEYFEHLATNRLFIFYDPRNRGFSDGVADESKLARGIHHDVDDLEALRTHYGLEQMAILAHSYIGVAAILYAISYPGRVSRLILIGAPPPDPSVSYQPPLRSSDGTLETFQQRFAELRNRMGSLPPGDFCQQAWDLLRKLYVEKQEDADRLHWAPCDVPNELNFLQPFLKYIAPSLAALRPTAEFLAKATAPVLLIHGRNDRSAPYGGCVDWARLLPNARLLTVDHAAHVPWIEAPNLIYGAIETFLGGAWPSAAEQIRS